MQATEIRLELDRIVFHDMLCKSKRKVDPEECSCKHKESVEELNTFVRHLLKGIR